MQIRGILQLRNADICIQELPTYLVKALGEFSLFDVQNSQLCQKCLECRVRSGASPSKHLIIALLPFFWPGPASEHVPTFSNEFA